MDKDRGNIGAMGRKRQAHQGSTVTRRGNPSADHWAAPPDATMLLGYRNGDRRLPPGPPSRTDERQRQAYPSKPGNDDAPAVFMRLVNHRREMWRILAILEPKTRKELVTGNPHPPWGLGEAADSGRKKSESLISPQAILGRGRNKWRSRRMEAAVSSSRRRW